MTRKDVGAEDIYSGLLVRFRGVGEVMEYHDDYTTRYILLFRSFFGVAFLGRDHKYYILQRAGFRHRILSVDKISAPLLKYHVVRRLSQDELEKLRKYVDMKRPATDRYNETVWRDIDRALNLRYGEPHLMQWELGDTSEDHLANAACNLMFMISMQERNKRGVVIKLPEGEFRVPDELIDMPKQHEEGRK